MKMKGFLHEKGRVYIPESIRDILKPERIISELRIPRWHKYHLENCLLSMGITENDLPTYCKNYKNFFVLAKIGSTGNFKGKVRFLILFSPLVDECIDKFFHHKYLSCKKWLFKLEGPMLVRLDKAGKVSIPKSHRRYAGIDYKLKYRRLDSLQNKYVEKKILLIKRKVILEIWNQQIWNKTPESMKDLFDDERFDSVCSWLMNPESMPR